jgi:Tol biopolymer transport system component/DNA-binding winged helix-turn-helix (wHTH) protein
MAEGSLPGRQVVRFGVFELDLRAGELSGEGRRQKLPEQPFAILVALLDRPGEVVTRDELRQRLWPADTFVDFEHGVNAAVKRLRDALGDSADSPRFIETIPRRGYRFIGPIEPSQVPAADPSLQVASRATTTHQPVLRRKRLLIATGAVAVIAGFVAATWWMASRAVTRPRSREHKLTRVTFGPGFDTDPTWSPDGRFIAYSSNRSGNLDLWVQALDGGEPRQLTHSPAADAEPTWATDGSDLIVFRSERDGGGLFAVPAHGGPERRLTSFGTRPSWAPDGSGILFEAIVGLNRPPQFFIVRPDGGQPRQVLKAFTDETSGIQSWSWHPDSLRVTLLGSHRRFGNGLFTVSLLDQRGDSVLPQPEVLSANAATVQSICQFPWWTDGQRAFEWNRSGTALYFGCAHGSTVDLWRFDVDPSTLRIMTTERMTTGDQALPLAVAPDGRRVIHVAGTMRLRLWAFPFDASTSRVLGEGEVVSESGAYVRDMTLRQDGRALIYRLERPGAKHDELWRIDFEPRRSHRLPIDGQHLAALRWSRDGTQIAYSASKPIPDTGLVEQGVLVSRDDGHDMRPLTVLSRIVPGGAVTSPGDWSPDGRWMVGSMLLVASPSWCAHGLTLWSTAADSRIESSSRVLAFDERYDLWQSRFSPDGRWVSFVAWSRDRPDTNSVRVIPATASRAGERDWVALTDPELWSDKPRWSPDGKMLYFTRWKDRTWNVWAVPFDSTQGRALGEAFQVTHFDSSDREPSPLLVEGGIEVSATRLIVPMIERSGNIWIVSDFDHQ